MIVKHQVSCKSRRIIHKKVKRYNRKTKQHYEIQYSFGRALSYVHKFICKEVVEGSRRKEKVDKDGVVHPVGELYKYDHHIPHNTTRMLVYRWIKDLPLFSFVISGGDGVNLVKAAKKAAVRGVRNCAKKSDVLSNFVGDSGNVGTTYTADSRSA